MTIQIIDLGINNVRSLVSAFTRITDTEISVHSSPKNCKKSQLTVLPGIGNFGRATSILEEDKIAIAIEKSYWGDTPKMFFLPGKASVGKVDYTPGNMVLFDSFMPHLVRPFKVRKKADRRITLVVHFNYRKHTERNPFPHLEYWY
mgnify:CR=1 FL=1